MSPFAESNNGSITRACLDPAGPWLLDQAAAGGQEPDSPGPGTRPRLGEVVGEPATACRAAAACLND